MNCFNVNMLTVFVSYFRTGLAGLLFFLYAVRLLKLQLDSLVCPLPPILQRLHQLLQPQRHPRAALGTLGRGRSIGINPHIQQRVTAG